MAGTSSSGSVNSARYCSPNELQKDRTPLWGYVTLVNRNRKGENITVGETRYWKCNYCNREYNGSYSRVKWHLLKISGKGIALCSKVDNYCLAEMKKLQKDADDRTKSKQVPLPPPTVGLSPLSQRDNIPIQSEYNPGKRRAVSPLERAFNQGARENLHAEIARMFYTAGLSLHLACNPFFISSFQYAANNVIPGYKPPSYNALLGPLLQKERANIERLLEPIKGTWSNKGVSIVTYGWTDIQRRSLINVMAVFDGDAMFLKAIDGSKEHKDRFYMAELMREVIEGVKPHNVVQIITDNAAVCKAAGKLIEADYPRIFWTPCVVHTLTLALKNICAAKNTEENGILYDECHWIKVVEDDAMFIKTFIMSHSMRLAIFNEFVPLKLLAMAETRFASTIGMFKRLKLIKTCLRTMVISEAWNTYKEDDVKKAVTVKDLVLNDSWWEKIDYILSFTRPIYDLLRFVDTNKPTLHLIYEMWNSMIKEVKESIYKHEKKLLSQHSSFYEVVYGIIIDHWTKGCMPLHYLAHSLNPRYYTPQWINGASNRVPPHRDAEISRERVKCFNRYFNDPDERKLVLQEYSKFCLCSEFYSSPDSLEDRWNLDPKGWWLNYGSFTPILQRLALRLLGQPCSSSCCGRNWSTYSFMHSLKRTKITPKRAEDLVFVHNNLRLLSIKNEKYSTGQSRMWDVNGNTLEPFDGVDGLGVEQELVGESSNIIEDEE
ncbi:uncharacterized protein LOC129299303 [Prosopis cineraria]|uniref:uncharacterized protein LOC129299303 n=1 Tax=Prosopis cineraria TaxID=364024 RepID=UPI002410AC60|nr:uncharacterized protein LOC129299303 [Prosopis cineraria]